MELLIVVDRSSPRLLQMQLYDELRRLILSGVVASGQRLPSSRKVAEQLELARNTVVLAYERLVVEGYVVSREKAGFFVNDRLPDAAMLIRNGHVQETSSNGRIRVGKIPTFSGR
ncbi:MAG: GntR family transcriptional regulator, partial [Nevskia sp.]|uniref:GntR family transcriptional regulator n=1 Tax=Nevskia sp. TaxID=1929292 RepID=UPI004035F3C3